MTRRIPIPVVAGIIWKEGQFLCAERPQGKDYAGWWEFPGGKVEKNESLGNALVRELQEELGITPTRFDFWIEKIVDYPEYTVKLHFFDIWEFTGEVTSLENQRFDWFNLTALVNVKFLPVNYKILEMLQTRELRSNT
ncbi:(deoxy)nucleoside triphosphate pyrophosphohydrolase [Maridesulfovibrio hydrothermalis]|uniref:8-oxo-dGTP diphosphatase n=1 Tax=Maridesulfovibrio hydrothermalis AM13 = DSM 14728 TaxID=1121451 RepID=L0RF65_9BACT|nr:NUDIX domain-containing protein [Maridesulfovibrio hydrothermalis]CCO24211.1 NUDIX hydrolase [Maridesulfovibrio hydrothermalis AM13 = DSM 14728]